MGNVVFGREGQAPPQIGAQSAQARMLASAEESFGRPLGLSGLQRRGFKDSQD